MHFIISTCDLANYYKIKYYIMLIKQKKRINSNRN